MGSMPVLFIDTAHVNEYRAATFNGREAMKTAKEPP
jgi:hypothetical protein